MKEKSKKKRRKRRERIARKAEADKMNPMDDALIDRLTAQAQHDSKKGRKAEWRLERLIARRIKMA